MSHRVSCHRPCQPPGPRACTSEPSPVPGETEDIRQGSQTPGGTAILNNLHRGHRAFSWGRGTGPTHPKGPSVCAVVPSVDIQIPQQALKTWKHERKIKQDTGKHMWGEPEGPI